MNKRKTVNSPILRVLFSQGVFNTATSIIASPVMPLYYRSTGASIAELGLISMLSYLGYAFFTTTCANMKINISVLVAEWEPI